MASEKKEKKGFSCVHIFLSGVVEILLPGISFSLLLTSSLLRHKRGNRYEMISGSFVFTKKTITFGVTADWPRNRQSYEKEIRYGFTYSVRNLKFSL